MNDVAVCGNCGNKFSEHYHEKYGSEVRHYCNDYTTGDVFTSEPPEEEIIGKLIENHNAEYVELLRRWQIENGHEPTY